MAFNHSSWFRKGLVHRKRYSHATGVWEDVRHDLEELQNKHPSLSGCWFGKRSLGPTRALMGFIRAQSRPNGFYTLRLIKGGLKRALHVRNKVLSVDPQERGLIACVPYYKIGQISTVAKSSQQ